MALCLSENQSQCTLQVSGYYIAAGRKVQLPWAGIHKWRKAEQKDQYTGLQIKYSSAWALSLCVGKTGAFKNRKAVSFQIDRCYNTRLWPVILVNNWNSATSGESGMARMFANSLRRNTWDFAEMYEAEKRGKLYYVEPHLRIQRSQLVLSGGHAERKWKSLARQVLLASP